MTYERQLGEPYEPWERSVYVIADAKGHPLYIGKATGEKNPGFGGRYYAALPAVPALAHGAKKYWHVGQIDGKPRIEWYTELERELIALDPHST